MKKQLLALSFALAFGLTLTAQSADQNPRAQLAYEAYQTENPTDHANTMGVTMDQTYEAYDPILIKEARRQERRDFRRQLRLERARRPQFIAPRRPWGWYGW